MGESEDLLSYRVGAGGADIVIMVHPDYQYTPMRIPAMVSMIANGLHRASWGGVHHGRLALRGGMPGWKYLVNRFLSCTQNLLMSAKLSEYHTGYRACSRELMESMRLENLSDDFIFDKQFLPQVVWWGFTIGEVNCPTKYSEEVSSINFRRSLKYGLGWLGVAWTFRWHKWCGGFPRYIY